MDFYSVYKASRRCRRRKRATPQAQFYEAYLLDNLVETVQALGSGSWRPRRPVCFTVDKPKAREIHAANYHDRVVHHWLVPRLEELYEPVFIHDVYSNRPGKGTHLAVKRLQSFMRGVVRNPREQTAHLRSRKDESVNKWPCRGYFLQLDIKNFFNSIDRKILFILLQKRLRKAVLQGKVAESAAVRSRDISHIILKQDVGKESFIAATREEVARVPAYKRLVNSGKDKGLPIGNLTSQFFANVYLNELDQFVKHTLKCHYYLRYVDDFILLHNSAAQLQHWRAKITSFLATHLTLELKCFETPQPVNQGANFLGYIIRPDYLLIRQRVIGNLWEKLSVFEKKWVKPGKNKGWVILLLMEPRDKLRSVLASYLGHFKHACHHRLIRKIFFRFQWLHCLFTISNDRFIPLWQPHSVTSYTSQQRFFQKIFPHARIGIQCGCTYDWLLPSGIPHRQIPADDPCYHVSKVIVRQQGYLKGGLRRRCVESITIEPQSKEGVFLCGSASA